MNLRDTGVGRETRPTPMGHTEDFYVHQLSGFLPGRGAGRCELREKCLGMALVRSVGSGWPEYAACFGSLLRPDALLLSDPDACAEHTHVCLSAG